MKQINIWELGVRINIKIRGEFLKKVKTILFKKYKTKRNAYNQIKSRINMVFVTFSSVLKENYHKKPYFTPIELWVNLCQIMEIDLHELQRNIIAYKTSNGPNYISNPILPIKITPIFDMIIAHNIADGTVKTPKQGRLPYFGYRQFDPLFRELYIKKLEAIFGKINFKNDYYMNSTRPYCPPVIAQPFFNLYHLNTESFLSKQARIPSKILNKSKDYLLAVLIAFIIDEGGIDSTLICIKLKNVALTKDLYEICKKLGYKTTLTTSGDYGSISILRDCMKNFFQDYKKALLKYPELTLGKFESKIENGFKIYSRSIYKTKGNRDLILHLLKNEDLTVNQIAQRINMTRQGVRFHVHKLEKANLIKRKCFIGKENIVYCVIGGGERC